MNVAWHVSCMLFYVILCSLHMHVYIKYLVICNVKSLAVLNLLQHVAINPISRELCAPTTEPSSLTFLTFRAQTCNFAFAAADQQQVLSITLWKL